MVDKYTQDFIDEVKGCLNSGNGGSGADDVARAAIEAHAGNSAIHLTAEQINGVDGGKTVEKSASYTLDNAVDYPLIDLRLYGKSTQDGVPSPENPVEIVSVGDSGTVGVTACGKNLLDNTATSVEKAGLSFTINNDGTIKVTGTPTADVYVIVNPSHSLIVGEKYILSGCPEGGGKGKYRLSLRFGESGAYRYFFDTGNGLEFTALESTVFVYFEVFANVTVDFIVYPMIRPASVEDDTYEPYKGSTVTLPYTLQGIPVDADGNYTDSNGQQWICDELIYNADGTGKIIKRIGETNTFVGRTPTNVDGKYRFIFEPQNVVLPVKSNACVGAIMSNVVSSTIAGAGGTSEANNGVSVGTSSTATFFHDDISAMTLEEANAWATEHNLKIIYALAVPQEINLTAEEMSQLQALHTFDGVTNVSNDKGAEMLIKYCTNSALSEYVKPIKTGLQKQIDELKSAVLSLGGSV